MDDKTVWLEEVAATCSVTLSILNKKAEQDGHVSEPDQVMSNICMGYLYLLNVCDSAGVLDDFVNQHQIGTVLNRTIH
jgi:hypothetical protein